MKNTKSYIILVGILGTAFEWLEYSYYGYITTKISQLFFPQYDSRTGILATLGIFAAGFLMRPIGGLVFGYLGDKKGRKTALTLSLFLMGIGTFIMGLLPTYQIVGLYAPLFLLCCRLLQGLAVSGEFNGASIFLIEHCKNRYPTLAGSWVGTASALGMLFGALAATLVSSPHSPSWAWRVPFFFAFISCLIGNYLRYKLLESPLFIKATEEKKIVSFPLTEIFLHHKKYFLFNVLLAAFVSVYIYINNVYYVTFLIKHAHFNAHIATLLVALGELCVVIFFPLAAFLSDKFGYKNIMIPGLLCAFLITPFTFYSAQSHSILYIAIAQCCYGVCNAFACAPIFNFIYNLFPTQLRYTGNATAWSLGVAIFGSTAPLVANFLTQNSPLGITLYVSIFILFALILITHKMINSPVKDGRVITAN